MSANLDAKVALVEEIKDKLQRAKTVVVVDYRGMTVDLDTKMRAKFRESGSEYKVYKNRLVQKAMSELGLDCPILEGTNAIAFGYDDEIAPAKILSDSSSASCKLEVKFGIYNHQVVDGKEIEKLSKIPSRETLLSMLANVLSSPMRSLAIALKAVSEKE